jgi:HPr kinase/phosphorylase
VEIQVHGALVEVLGVGVLLQGPSGVGKSEIALELVQRGHRLVADDIVRIRRQTDDSRQGGGAASSWLVGRAPELIRHYMELRGIGLLHIPDLYGADAVRIESRVELICHLEPWRKEAEYERIGLERPTEELAGVAVPALVLPVRAARSMATLVEVAVRDTLQRRAGVNAARRLDARLRERKDAGGEGNTGGEGGAGQ